LRGKLKVPAFYIGGSESIEGRLARLAFMKKHFLAGFQELPGTHLFPLEIPDATADAIVSA
jgi:hypothetical protein